MCIFIIFNGGDLYFKERYQALYNDYLFSLMIWGGDPKLRACVLDSSIRRCDNLLKSAVVRKELSLGFIGRLNKRTKMLMERKYRELYG